MLGYGLDAAYEGRGMMREALEVAIGYMFADQNLHRIQANYVPRNERSGGLLRRLLNARRKPASPALKESKDAKESAA